MTKAPKIKTSPRIYSYHEYCEEIYKKITYRCSDLLLDIELGRRSAKGWLVYTSGYNFSIYMHQPVSKNDIDNLKVRLIRQHQLVHAKLETATSTYERLADIMFWCTLPELFRIVHGNTDDVTVENLLYHRCQDTASHDTTPNSISTTKLSKRCIHFDHNFGYCGLYTFKRYGSPVCECREGRSVQQFLPVKPRKR